MSERGRLLGVDYGTVRVGIAVCDIDRRIASPLLQHQRRTEEQDAIFFRALVERERAAGMVVGLPISLNGTEGPKALEARTFGQWLAKVTSLPIFFWDERFTSVLAEEALRGAGLTHKKRRDRRDQVAAQIVLQSYLDAGCPPENPLAPQS